jgi:hypothetical protein
LLVGDSYSLDTAGESYSLSLSAESMEETDQINSFDTDQSVTDDDMDERSTCSEVLPSSKKMEREESNFAFCSSDTITYDFPLVADLLERSSTLFSTTDGCLPDVCAPKKRFSRRGDRRVDSNSKATSSAAKGCDRRFAC